jgi:hypothetical protein
VPGLPVPIENMILNTILHQRDFEEGPRSPDYLKMIIEEENLFLKQHYNYEEAH